MQQWPINLINQDREAFMKHVASFITEKIFNDKRSIPLSDEIAKVIYLERIRITQNPWRVDPPDELDFWNQIRKQLLKKSLDQVDEKVNDNNKKILQKIITRYVREIMSDFRIPTYKFARGFLPRMFNITLSASKLFRSHKNLKERLQIVGHIETILKLTKIGTVVLVPDSFFKSRFRFDWLGFR